MRKILVLTDFSDNSFNALDCAHRLFSKDECTFLLLHSIEAQMSTSTSRVDYGKRVQVFEELEKAANEGFKEFIGRLERIDDGKHTFDMQITTEDLRYRVNKLVADEGISLVMMGAKGRTAARDIFMGSNTINMIRSIEGCPVISIPEDHDFVPPIKFALATDFRRPIQIKQIAQLVELAKYLDARVDVLHVAEEEALSPEQQANRALLEDGLEGVDYHYKWLLDTGRDTSEIIGNYVSQNGYHMLAMMFRKRSFFDRLFREKVIKRVGFNTTTPFMVIPEIG